jgi:hypothetical protein
MPRDVEHVDCGIHENLYTSTSNIALDIAKRNKKSLQSLWAVRVASLCSAYRPSTVGPIGLLFALLLTLSIHL